LWWGIPAGHLSHLRGTSWPFPCSPLGAFFSGAIIVGNRLWHAVCYNYLTQQLARIAAGILPPSISYTLIQVRGDATNSAVGMHLHKAHACEVATNFKFPKSRLQPSVVDAFNVEGKAASKLNCPAGPPTHHQLERWVLVCWPTRMLEVICNRHRWSSLSNGFARFPKASGDTHAAAAGAASENAKTEQKTEPSEGPSATVKAEPEQPLMLRG
jgi:hypothetical protein